MWGQKGKQQPWSSASPPGAARNMACVPDGRVPGRGQSQSRQSTQRPPDFMRGCQDGSPGALTALQGAGAPPRPCKPAQEPTWPFPAATSGYISVSSSSWRSSAAGRKAGRAGGYAGAARDQGTECQATPRGAAGKGQRPRLSAPPSPHATEALASDSDVLLAVPACPNLQAREVPGGGPHTSQGSPNSALARAGSVC